MSKKKMISPNFEVSYVEANSSIEKKIDVFEDQINNWQLNFAEKIKSLPNSEIAVLSILFSYFENISKYQEGFTDFTKSEEYFIKGFRSVFPDIESWGKDLRDNTLKGLYKAGRCGLYHSTLPSHRIYLATKLVNPLVIDKSDRNNPNIYIDHQKLPYAIRHHFQNYIISLRDIKNITLRENFEKRFDKLILRK